MRAALSGLEVLRPRSLAQALEWLADRDDRPIPLAGGTDLFVYLNAGTQPEGRYLDLSAVRGLGGVRLDRGAVSIGALATFSELRADPVICRRLPSLAAAAAEVGGWQIQNRATLGGNVANASPAGDSLPVLLAHDAVVHVRSVRGARAIEFERLYLGYRRLALEPDELITGFSVPLAPPRATAFFRKIGTRRAQSISKVVMCALLGRDRAGAMTHVRIAYGSVAPVPVRARAAEAALAGRPSRARAEAALAALGRDIAPIDDVRSEADYRMAIAGNVLRQALRVADPGFARG